MYTVLASSFMSIFALSFSVMTILFSVVHLVKKASASNKLQDITVEVNDKKIHLTKKADQKEIENLLKQLKSS